MAKPLSELTDKKVTKFVIRYSYEWNPIVPSGQRDTDKHPSRRFCKALMAANRVYSRSDIETMTARLGYSVFDRKGGWWTKANGVHSPSCRHEWKNNILIEK